MFYTRFTYWVIKSKMIFSYLLWSFGEILWVHILHLKAHFTSLHPHFILYLFVSIAREAFIAQNRYEITLPDCRGPINKKQSLPRSLFVPTRSVLALKLGPNNIQYLKCKALVHMLCLQLAKSTSWWRNCLMYYVGKGEFEWTTRQDSIGIDREISCSTSPTS